MKSFSQKTLQQIGHYVYLLVDPADGHVFYAGRGQNNRCFDHIDDARKGAVSEKCDVIRDILARKKNNDVEIYILRYGLSEDAAKIVEASVIDLLDTPQLKVAPKLTNKYRGFGVNNGIISVQDLDQRYNLSTINNNLLTDPTRRIIIIRITQPVSRPIDIYNATRAAWVMDIKRARKADYVLGVRQGVILGMYDDLEWSKNGDRCEFTGRDISTTKLGKQYVNHILPPQYRVKGMANPIRYNY